MHSPTGAKEGLVIIKKLQNDICRNYGTTIEVVFLLEKFGGSFSRSIREQYQITEHFLASYDPILDEALPIEATLLADRIQTFAKHAPLLIRGQLTTLNRSTPFSLGDKDSAEDSSSQSWNFVEVNGQQLALIYEPLLSTHSRFQALYRGQSFTEIADLPNVEIIVNLLSGKAGEWLTANRDKLINSAKQEFYELVLAALEKIVTEDMESPNKIDSKLKPVYSFFLEAMALDYGNNWDVLAKTDTFKGAWLDLQTPNKEISFRKLFEKDLWLLGNLPSHGQSPVEGCDLRVDGHTIKIILNEWLKSEDRTMQIVEPENYQSGNYSLRFQLKKGTQPLYSEKALATRLAGILRQVDGNRRFFLYFQDNLWQALYLKIGTKCRALPLFDVRQRAENPVLLPFLFRLSGFSLSRRYDVKVEATASQLDALCKWVQPHLEVPASVTEIRNEYDKLIDYIDNTVMRSSPHWEVWKNARGID